MSDGMIFERHETKYFLTPAQKEHLLALIDSGLSPDPYPHYTVSNLYLDTPDFRLIRASMEATTYKEKLRLRSYAVPGPDSPVFLELKKKYLGVVYKRRVTMTLREAYRYLWMAEHPFRNQILREIDYAMDLYRHPNPACGIFYEREAWYMTEDPQIRVTFDTGIRWRTDNLKLENGTEGKPLFNDDRILLELKTGPAIPLRLGRALAECGILRSSFSKYGTAYTDMLRPTETEADAQPITTGTRKEAGNDY